MRLIDADELVRKEIAFVGGPRSGGKTLAMIHSAIRYIVDNAPTVIAEPVRHGKWLPTKDDNKKRCSECDVICLIAVYPFGEANFCPVCGCRMDGD